jgi:hypothetical protein
MFSLQVIVSSKARIKGAWTQFPQQSGGAEAALGHNEGFHVDF